MTPVFFFACAGVLVAFPDRAVWLILGFAGFLFYTRRPWLALAAWVLFFALQT